MVTKPIRCRDLVEPGALTTGTMASREGYVSAGECELSVAISLKRIADALTSTGLDDLVTSSHGPLTNLAWEAGRSFGAGTRTDR